MGDDIQRCSLHWLLISDMGTQLVDKASGLEDVDLRTLHIMATRPRADRRGGVILQPILNTTAPGSSLQILRTRNIITLPTW